MIALLKALSEMLSGDGCSDEFTSTEELRSLVQEYRSGAEKNAATIADMGD